MMRGRPRTARSYKKRRLYRAKRRLRRRRVGIMGRPSGIPVRRRARLRYVDNIELTSSTGVIASHVFRANSIYDPDLTGTGHQPMGRDQMAQFFAHYVVVGSKITVEWLNNAGSSASESPCIVGVYLNSDTSVTYTDINSFKEAKRGSFKTMQWVFMPVTTYKYSAKKFYNIKDVKDNVRRIGAPIGLNPDDGAYYQLLLQAIGSYSASLTARVTIDYIVDFSEPQDIAVS